MTHYERAAKYVNKKLGKHFAKQHIESLEKQFKQVAEEAMNNCAEIALHYKNDYYHNSVQSAGFDQACCDIAQRILSRRPSETI